METITIKAEPDKMKALKNFLKAFDISFTSSKAMEESPYDTAFVANIQKACEEDSFEIDPKNLWESIGSK